jgi:hypothetical protein
LGALIDTNIAIHLRDGLPEDLDEDELDALPEPPEQAALAAIHAELDAVRYQDKWPQHLHWGNI